LIGDIAYGTGLNTLSQGPDCRILQLFEIVLPELMKCGLFPLRGKFPILRQTRDMYRAITELRGMAEKAIENVRGRNDDSNNDEGKKGYNGRKRSYKIFEVLAEYVYIGKLG